VGKTLRPASRSHEFRNAHSYQISAKSINPQWSFAI